MLTPISKEVLHNLSERRDGPAVVQMTLQSLALMVSAFASARLGDTGGPAHWAALAALAISILSFFPLLHEAGHQTAFASRPLNEIAVWMGALVMLQAPSFFREFHWEHHRSTQDPALDPEIASAPGLLDGWPTNPITYLMLVSGQGLLVGKLGFTLACAIFPRSLWVRLFPFIRADHRARVAWESRLALGFFAVFTIVGFSFVPGFIWILSGWPIAHVLLGFYLMPEHTGLPHVGSQVERTRTVDSSGLLRQLMWNMPYHAEHHVHPGVPYHRLPELHRHLEPALVHRHKSYTAFHFEAIDRALRIHTK